MEREGSQGRGARLLAFIGAGVLFLTSAVSVTMPAFADDSVTLSCYNGTEYIDDVDDVVDVANAGQVCNSLYTDCEGNCTGCFHDFDYDENVCVDSQGRKFLQ